MRADPHTAVNRFRGKLSPGNTAAWADRPCREVLRYTGVWLEATMRVLIAGPDGFDVIPIVYAPTPSVGRASAHFTTAAVFAAERSARAEPISTAEDRFRHSPLNTRDGGTRARIDFALFPARPHFAADSITRNPRWH